MDDLHSTANALLAHAPALMLAIGTMVSIGVIVVIAILLWQRKPLHDAAGEQRMVELNARIQTMGGSARQGPVAATANRARTP